MTKPSTTQSVAPTPHVTRTTSDVVPQRSEQDAAEQVRPEGNAQVADTRSLLDVSRAGPEAVTEFNAQRARGLLPPPWRQASLRRAYLHGAQLSHLRAPSADLRDADLRSADLRHADLSGANLEHADLRNANLEQANLRGSYLHGAQVSGASLQRADLRNVHGLQTRQLSGTDLSGAKLPRDLDVLAGVAATDEWSRNNRTLYLGVLLSCLYCLLTIVSTKDAALKLDMPSSELPFIDLQIPLRHFYWVAPWVLLAVFAFLQVNLQRLWQQISQLPTAFPDGRQIDEVLDPWLLAQIARIRHWQWSAHEAVLMWGQALASGFLAWALVPLVLVALWWRALVVDSSSLSMTQGIAVLVAIGISYISYRSAMLTLSYGEFRMRPLRGLRRSPAWVALVISAWTLCSYGLGQVVADHRRDHFAVSLYGAQLPGRYLAGADAILNNASLPGSNLESATLIDAQLRGVNLMNSDMQHVRLQHADLTRAKLMNADFTRAVLSEATLRDADLREAQLRAAECNSADFTRAQLASADLSGVKLNGAVLQRADLWGATLKGAYLLDADLERAALVRADMQEAVLLGASLEGAHLDEAKLDDAELSHTNLIGAELRKASGPRVLLTNALLIDAQLMHATLPSAGLDGAQLDYANLSAAELTDASLHDAMLLRTDLSGSSLRNADLTGAHLIQTNLRGADLAGSDLTDADFRGVDVSGAQLAEAKGLTAAQLAGLCGTGTLLINSDDHLRSMDLQPCAAELSQTGSTP